MKKFFALCALSLFLSLPGCGDSSEPKSVVEQGDEAIIAEIEAQTAADAAEMDADASTLESTE